MPYRRIQGALDQKCGKFKTHLSGQRIFVEHCIGILKGRFSSLGGCELTWTRLMGTKRVVTVEVIEVVTLLYNNLIKMDLWNKEEDELYLEPDLEDENPPPFCPAVTTSSDTKRRALVQIINAVRN